MDLTFRGIEIGPVEIRFYALALMTGLVLALLVARAELLRRGEDPEHISNMVLIGLPLSLLLARLYHVFDRDNWPFYQANPDQILAVWQGGMGIFGAVAGALITVVGYTAWKRLNVGNFLDAGAPALLLGQAIGRWGNFFNQELYGRPTDVPWAIPIDPENRLPGFEDQERFHPLFLYESILNLVGVGVLLLVARRFRTWLKPGDVAILYFIWYPATRFSLEFLRLGSWTEGGVAVAQWVSAALILAAVALLAWRHRDDMSSNRPDRRRPGRTSRRLRARAR